MLTTSAPESITLDRTDRQVIHALQLDPRAAFSRIAEALDVSEQTVARRYRRLWSGGVLRVIGIVDPRALGESDWLVRVRCRPDGTLRLAEALARRDDVAWVSLNAGGSEIACAVRSRSEQQRVELLLQRLPNAAQVLDISALVVLKHFLGGAATDWLRLGDLLTKAQIRQLSPAHPPTPPTDPVRLTAEDEPLLNLLRRDGRASYAALAKASGLTEGRVVRRLEAMRASGVVYFDLDLATGLLGFATTAYLWLTVAPARLHAVGEELATHAEVAFAAAMSGPSNLVLSVICRDLDELYEYVTTRIGTTDGVQAVEVSPMLRRIKQAGSLMDGPRIANLVR